MRSAKALEDVDTDALADEADELVKQMHEAFARDEETVLAGLQLPADKREPALAKLSLLPEVTRKLCSAHLQPFFIEKSGLNALFTWLKPVRGLLPPLPLRKKLLGCLHALRLEKAAIEASGLGKLMALYADVLPDQDECKFTARRLLDEWKRVVYAEAGEAAVHRYEMARVTRLPSVTMAPAHGWSSAGATADAAPGGGLLRNSAVDEASIDRRVHIPHAMYRNFSKVPESIATATHASQAEANAPKAANKGGTMQTIAHSMKQIKTLSKASRFNAHVKY